MTRHLHRQTSKLLLFQQLSPSLGANYVFDIVVPCVMYCNVTNGVNIGVLCFCFLTEQNVFGLDHVAVPDFSAGAMENWGLVLYRETALLHDDTQSSIANKYWVSLIMAHEIAHSVSPGLDQFSVARWLLDFGREFHQGHLRLFTKSGHFSTHSLAYERRPTSQWIKRRIPGFMRLTLSIVSWFPQMTTTVASRRRFVDRKVATIDTRLSQWLDRILCQNIH